MLRVHYTILCQFQRAVGGGFDLLGTFENIKVSSVPVRMPRLVFVALLTGDSEDDIGKKDVVFRCVAPSGRPVLEQLIQADLRPEAGAWLLTQRIAVEVEHFPVFELGRYRFVLEVAGEQVAVHPMLVQMVKEQPGGAATA